MDEVYAFKQKFNSRYNKLEKWFDDYFLNKI